MLLFINVIIIVVTIYVYSYFWGGPWGSGFRGSGVDVSVGLSESGSRARWSSGLGFLGVWGLGLRA